MKHTIFIRVSSETFEELKRLAKRYEMPVSTVARKLLKSALLREKKKEETYEKRGKDYKSDQ